MTAWFGWLLALIFVGVWIAHERRRAATRAARIDRLTARIDREIGRWALAKDRAAQQWLDVIETLDDLQAREIKGAAMSRHMAVDQEARELMDGIAARERRDAVAAERERRERLYRAARAASETWRPGSGNDRDLEPLRRHVCDLASESPAITIHWLSRDSATEKIVKKGNAVALTGHQTIMVQPIVNEPTYVTVLHELGHLRTNAVGTLQREVAAWSYCRRVAMVWGEEAQKTMVRSINTYVAAAERTATNLLGAAEVEKLCSQVEYAQERQRRVEQEIERERKNQ